MERAERLVCDRIARHCQTTCDSRGLRAQVLSELQHVMPFDWYVWVVTDPRSCVGVDPLAVVPDLRRLPEIIRLKYATPVNRWTELISAACLGPRAAHSPLWREVQNGMGVVDVASVAFRDRHGCWGFLDLWSAVPFTAEHLRLLDHMTATLTRALRERQAAMLRHHPDELVPIDGSAVVLLDRGLAVKGMTPAASALLSRLLPRPDGGPSVPAAAYNVAAQLLATEAGLNDAPPEGRVHLAEGQWITIRSSQLDRGPMIAVTLEKLSAEDRFDLCVRAFGLSEREAQVLAAVASGESTTAIGRALCLSTYTVQDHVGSIFAKTGAASRRELVPLVLGSARA